MKIPVLSGQLVKLRPINYEYDHEKWFEVEQDENMHIWTGNTIPQSPEEVKTYLYDLYPKHFLIWMIEEKTNGNVIGMMRISHPERHDSQLVAGDSQRLLSGYWRKGFMKESRRLLYDYVFNVLKVDMLYADVWEGNINSCRSLEAAGYNVLKIEREYFKKYDRMQNKLYYTLKSSSWKARTQTV